ncbi:MAG: hypothetical protein IJT85_09360 [Ruminococcus sp.]|nr:hypothetical protein [Ruminococcus sp.]
MKTKIKRHSRTVLSVILAVCMLASCMAVGIIATSAAYVDGKSVPEAANAADIPGGGTNGSKDDGEALGAAADDEAVGATYYLLLSYNSNKPTDMTNYVSSSSATFTVTPSSFGKSSFETGRNYYVGISSGTSYTNMYSQNGSSSIGTVTGSLTANVQNYNYGEPSVRYNFAYFCITDTSVQSVTVSVSGGDNTTYSFAAANTSYTISYGSTTNGSFTTAPTSANSGSTVTVVATPSTGYAVSSVTYTPSGGSAAACTNTSGNTYTFTMPSANVTVNATFTQASYTVSANCTGCAITGLGSSYHYGDTVAFTVAPETDYALKSLTVKQGSTTITTTNTGGNAYTFTMPAGNVTITAVCANTAGTATIYFKSATAYVYVPYVSVNGGAEVKMTVDRYLTNSANSYNPKSETGSLRYAWYKAEISGLNTTSATTVKVRGQDTYMEATGSFNITDGGTIYLACDNLMEGSTLVDISSLATDLEALDFYDTPLNMIDN